MTKKQWTMLWGEGGPYSEVNLIKEIRILDDKASRTFLRVEVNINPTTFKLVKKHRNDKEFKDDIIVQQLLDFAQYYGQAYGYKSYTFSDEYRDKKKLKEAEKSLKYAQKTVIKMHKFIMDKI